MNAPEPTNPEGIPAATIVVFRNGRGGGAPEMLMVTRAKSMSFAGGAAVFPGGRVDDEDFELAQAVESNLTPDEAAHRVAAIRETLEETGLAVGLVGEVDAAKAAYARRLLLDKKALHPVIEEMGWTLNLDEILPFARWFPKNEKLSRVFDTRFYLANLGTGEVDITVDETENTKLFWTSAQGALDAAERGDLSIIFPTRRNLERLAQFSDFSQAEADCNRHPVKLITPFVAERDNQPWLCIPDDAGYPVDGEPLENVMRG